MLPAISDFGSFVGGFVAAEGCFTGHGARRFRFSLGLGAGDSDLCRTLVIVLGVGSVYHTPRRRPHYDDEVQFVVQSTRALVDVIVPFMDEHLPTSHKRDQYLEWRARLLDHWEHHARRRARCSVAPCMSAAKAHGLCRHHLWRVRRE